MYGFTGFVQEGRMADIKVGNIIAARRKELGITQLRLAELMGVSEQAVRNWENGSTEPGKGRFSALSLGSIYPMPGGLKDNVYWLLGSDAFIRQIEGEKHMYHFIKSHASSKNWNNTLMALKYAKISHDGQTRKGDFAIPYITHPLNVACQNVACHAISLEINEDEVIATALLHDVCEDCDIAPEELPVSDEVREAVRLLTRIPIEGESREETLERYYSRLIKNRVATIVKLLDRCNNVSFMTFAFPDSKIREYIAETRSYVLPLLEEARTRYPVYRNAYFLIKYHIGSVINSIDVLVNRK